MRIAPVGLFLQNDLDGLLEVSRISSIVTHSHFLAVQGAALQATAIAVAATAPADPGRFLRTLLTVLSFCEKRGEDTTIYKKALARVGEGISQSVVAGKMAGLLGTGSKRRKPCQWPSYCYLSNADSFEKAIESAIFLAAIRIQLPL